MSPELEPSPNFTITAMTAEDILPANMMRLESWLDTYVNDELGVTREWIESRNKDQNSPEKLENRKKRLSDPSYAGWVAKDNAGEVIGVTTPFTDENGTQHVGSLYVSKDWLGKGLGATLMQKVIDWSDSTKPIELGVATYNERAKAFYRKWGFDEVPGSEELFADMIPEVKMIRKGDKK